MPTPLLDRRRWEARQRGETDMQEHASETVHAVREQAAALARELADQAAAKAVTGAARAREVGSTLAAGTSSKVRDVEQKVEADVVPTLDAAPPIEAIGVAARSMSQQSHIRIRPEHYERAVDALASIAR